MSRGGEIRLDWAGDEQVFRLAIGELRELQEKTNAGPAQLLRRMHDDSWRIDDVRETLRIGLIGGGMKPAAALALVRRYVDELETPPAEQVPVCRGILFAAVFGTPDEAVGDPASGEAAAADGSRTSSSSPPSTAAAPSSDGVPPRSTG